MYHVMARGDRREDIVRDDEDRRTFFRTLEAACGRTGFRVHAYVVMNNHYHLLLETPGANLSMGMGWLQNAFTRRINVRHGLWGHVFGDRYKAILIEPGNCFWALMDYIHLNPVRAGMVREEGGIESYPWSSLVHYLAPSARRPDWLETGMGFGVSGCKDTARGRREFLEQVESRVDWRSPRKAGVVLRDGEAGPQLATYSGLRRGWFFGSQEFKERLLRIGGRRLVERAARSSDGYSGAEVRDHSETEAMRLLEAGLKYFDLEQRSLHKLPKGIGGRA